MFSRPLTMAESSSSMGSVRVLFSIMLRAVIGIAAETPDGKAGPVDGQRGNDRVHTGAVGQARVHHGRGFIDAPPHARHDAVDDLHQVRDRP